MHISSMRSYTMIQLLVHIRSYLRLEVESFEGTYGTFIVNAANILALPGSSVLFSECSMTLILILRCDKRDSWLILKHSESKAVGCLLVRTRLQYDSPTPVLVGSMFLSVSSCLLSSCRSGCCLAMFNVEKNFVRLEQHYVCSVYYQLPMIHELGAFN